MATVNPYLTFNGNCEEAFTFYKSVFGGEFPFVGRFSDMPPTDGIEIPASESKKIMHITLPISDETILMGSDTSEVFGQSAVQGDNISISINCKSKVEAKGIFEKLSNAGKITMTLEKTFWGALFGMMIDKFGIQWMVNYDYEK